MDFITCNVAYRRATVCRVECSKSSKRKRDLSYAEIFAAWDLQDLLMLELCQFKMWPYKTCCNTFW